MNIYLETFILLILLAVCYQLYTFSVTSEGREKQGRCQKMGIAFMTFGITSLAFKSVPFAFFGLILIMFGFRLLAKGLDRLNKKTYIDQFDEDQ
jgi:Ca2+/Na+ antiporter